jgi:hypothetical protein
VGAQFCAGRLRRLQGGRDDHQSVMLRGQLITCRGERGGLARTGRTLDHHQLRVAGQCGDGGLLTYVEPVDGRGLDRRHRPAAARGEPGDEVGFDVEDVSGGEHADVLWR